MQDKCKGTSAKIRKARREGSSIRTQGHSTKGPSQETGLKKPKTIPKTSIHLGWLFIDVRTICSLITIYFLLNPSVYIKQYTKGPLSEEYQIITMHKDDLGCTSISFQFAPKPATSRKYPIRGNTSIGPGVP